MGQTLLSRSWNDVGTEFICPESDYCIGVTGSDRGDSDPGTQGELALRGADAVYLASAFVLRSRLAEEDDQLTLVVSDRELKAAAQSSGLATIDPEEQEAPASHQAEADEQNKQPPDREG